MKPTVIDLFAGVGGLSLGFKMAGFDIVLANECDKSIATAYKYNHSDTKVIVADIRNLPIDETFASFCDSTTVIIGGPPCQGFSQKGQRKSIYDERNFLFRYFVNVVDYVRPRYFVMENVPTLLTTANGYFKKEIIALFGDIGYNLECAILNAEDYGVPQNRRRAVIIGKNGESVPAMPEPVDYKVTIWDAISDLAYLDSGEGKDCDIYRTEPKSDYQQMLRNGSGRLFNHKATKHSELALERLRMIPPNRGKEFLPEEHLTRSIYS